MVQLRGLRHPIFLRPGTSDASEVFHSCVREAYGKHLPEEPVRLIVDAGANIGDSTVWYLNRFPQATVVAVEPDPDNFGLLRRNTEAYGHRVVLINAGLWSADDRLKLAKGNVASGISVAPADTLADSDCDGVSLCTIMRTCGANRIDILKLDIEGSERDLFAENADAWLDKTTNIVMEIHSKECGMAVLAATRRHSFNCVRYRELYIFERARSPRGRDRIELPANA